MHKSKVSVGTIGGRTAALALALCVGLAASGVGAQEPAAQSVAWRSATMALPRTERLAPSASRATVRLERAATAAEVMQRLEVERGKATVVRTGYGVKRVAVGDPAIMDVVVLGSSTLQLVAKAIGDTNVLIWDADNQLQAAIDVHVGTGNAQATTEIRRVLGNDSVEVDSAGESIVLKGTVANLESMEQALRVAQGFFPDAADKKVINLLSVGGDQQVMIEVKIAEMSRSLRRRIGTNFRALVTRGNTFEIFSFLRNLTALQGSEFGAGATQVISDRVNLAGRYVNPDSLTLDVFLELVEERGLGKILAEPTLVARSGDAADFLVGGEVPIPIAQGGAFGSVTVEYKPFGVGVKFSPTVLASDRIHLDVGAEVSEPDFSSGVVVAGFNVPSFNTRRASTAIELGDGQSFAVAGLLRDSVTAAVEKYPVLGDVPILGALFRSQEFQQNATELVLIVTPRLVKPLPPGPHKLPTDHYIVPDRFEFFGLGRLEGRAQPGLHGASSSVAPEGGVIGQTGHRVSLAR